MAEPARRLGGRSARIRRDVLDAATAILLEGGLDPLTVMAVSERSGVHHTSIYRRWGDRAALVCDALLDAVDTAVPVREAGSLSEELTHMLDDVVALYESPLGPVLLEAIRSSDPGLQTLRDTYLGTRVEQCAVIAQRAKARGEIPDDVDYRLVFELLLGPVLARTLLSNDGIKSLDSATVVHAVLNGVAPTPRP